MKEHSFQNEVVVEGELQLFRTLWHTSSDNLFIVSRDAEGEYISEKCNRSLELTFNMLPAQGDGVILRELVDETIYKKVTSRYDECIVKNVPITYEESFTDESGERFWITTILPITDNSTGNKRIFGISKEITTVHNAEKALKEINERLERQVSERTKELTLALEQMEKLSITDKLTNLYNRYKIEDTLQNEKNRAERYKTSFGILMLDIDYFKNINDNFGHIEGDRVLKAFASILKNYARESDRVGRWGGEEFLIITPESSEEELLSFADRLRITIQEHQFEIVGNITVSIGTTLYEQGDTVEGLIAKADKALYVSKNSGRNRVHKHL